MALLEVRGLENVSPEKSPGHSQTNYKKLYHESVERHAILQSQLESYSNLITKMGKIEQLKVELNCRQRSTTVTVFLTRSRSSCR